MDTACQNHGLTNNDWNDNPWWFGPSILHMSKKPETFMRFCIEMVVTNPALRNLKYLGTDMERALYQGFKVVVPELKNLLCVIGLAKPEGKKSLIWINESLNGKHKRLLAKTKDDIGKAGFHVGKDGIGIFTSLGNIKVISNGHVYADIATKFIIFIHFVFLDFILFLVTFMLCLVAYLFTIRSY